MDSEVIKQIEDTLDRIRPFIQKEGGDVQFVSFDEKTGTVYVKMNGACVGCMFLDSTLSDGIEALMVEQVPGVNRVKLADQEQYYNN